MENVLFISNELYLNERRPEGGVRVCTLEFIELLQQKYTVILFPVKINSSIAFKIKTRLGLGSYDAYKPDDYFDELRNTLEQHNIKLVFLNLSNLTRFGPVIKKAGKGYTKVILCSHGNESGDFLHEVVRFRDKISFPKILFSSIALGRMLKAESFYRLHFIDMVLTVSPLESEIEKWLGAKKVFMVPRTITHHFLKHSPIVNRIGFFGDLSHWPNRSGIISFCEALEKYTHQVNLRLTGGPSKFGDQLAMRFPFITYLGYLEEAELQKECATWSVFVNPVFYYSRGVSTKLAKALEWGIPVISTTAGTRGYIWKNGKMLIKETPEDMANTVIYYSTESLENIENTKKIALSMPTLEDIMQDLHPQLQTLLQ